MNPQSPWTAWSLPPEQLKSFFQDLIAQKANALREMVTEDSDLPGDIPRIVERNRVRHPCLVTFDYRRHTILRVKIDGASTYAILSMYEQRDPVLGLVFSEAIDVFDADGRHVAYAEVMSDPDLGRWIPEWHDA